MIYKIDNTNSIQKTINNMLDGDTLFLKNGIYKEKIIITKSNIKIIGESNDKTIISNNDYFHKIMPDYNECNTFRTYTCFISGENVSIENLTIENTSTPSYKYGQAVALHVHGNNFSCKNCIIKSAQDTLMCGPLPPDLVIRHQGFLQKEFLQTTPSYQEYHNCKISGYVDFIFGCGTVLFNECIIHSIANDPNNPQESHGYIAAPSHNKECEYGFLFYKCKITADKGVNNIFLARPWRDYGKVAFIDCDINSHIIPSGFNKWNNTNRDKTASFFEYSPNIDTTQRVKWSKQLNKTEADKYLDDFKKYSKKLLSK